MTRRGRLSRAEADSRVANLLDLALEEFARNGVAATSLDWLVKQSGVSKTTMFRRFGNKEGLFLALADRCIETFRTEVAAIRTDVDDPAGTLCEFLRALRSLAHDDQALAYLRLAIAERYTYPAVAQSVLTGQRQLMTPLAQYIETLMEQGVLRPADPQNAAFDLVSLASGGIRILLEDENAEGIDGDRHIHEVVNRFLNGWSEPAPSPTS